MPDFNVATWQKLKNVHLDRVARTSHVSSHFGRRSHICYTLVGNSRKLCVQCACLCNWARRDCEPCFRFYEYFCCCTMHFAYLRECAKGTISHRPKGSDDATDGDITLINCALGLGLCMSSSDNVEKQSPPYCRWQMCAQQCARIRRHTQTS